MLDASLPESTAIRGLPVSEIARRIGVHPSTVIRWVLKPKTLQSGRKVRLAATRSPGGWRIKVEDIDAYLDAITRDRLDDAEAEAPARTTNERRRAMSRTDLALDQAGINLN